MPVIEIVQKVWVPEVPDIELPYAERVRAEAERERAEVAGAENARLRAELE
jgi:hypothetical protein